MDKVINTVGIAIIASKYAAVVLLAGLSVSTGALAAELMIVTGIENGE